MFNQDLYLINNIELSVEIIPNDDEFMIIAPTTGHTNSYKLEIISCKLYVKTVELMNGLSLDIARKLDLSPARYALRKSMIKTLFITEGRTELNANIFTDQIPRRIALGMVKNGSCVRNKSNSPFYFEPFDVGEVTVTANGHNYPASPYNLDFPNNKYVRPFFEMNEALGFFNSAESNGITYQQYRKGWCVFLFNLTNSL